MDERSIFRNVYYIHFPAGIKKFKYFCTKVTFIQCSKINTIFKLFFVFTAGVTPKFWLEKGAKSQFIEI